MVYDKSNVLKKNATKSFRADDQTINLLERATQIRQVSESEIIRMALNKFYSRDGSLTELERTYAQQQIIISMISSIENILQITCIGNIEKRMENLLYFTWGNKIVYGSNNRIRKMETTIFEILDSIKGYDSDLHEELISKMEILNFSLKSETEISDMKTREDTDTDTEFIEFIPDSKSIEKLLGLDDDK